MQTVTLPDDVLYDLDLRVNAGEFASRDAAAAFFIRKGLERGPRPPYPPPYPPAPWTRREPEDDRPIQVDPTDVNWARRPGEADRVSAGR